ncbi:hypothetical protein R2R35_00825 [Anaerocolumna sp. AGMB13020]|uniref:hypothetical protein n=1 Tax=Anaerocolumna sp. AGMB13020 TaxID=3081750 RepID=UPI002953E74D|nr:hypothetical protein [Anaerocolumna sp. AGMB13020]WOO37069.1 hypothetical protein R2R35_00825 [Anaerocolumna sp. AGMB13020]
MKNIFIEGIPGSGKSTLLGKLQEKLPEYKFYREGEISPVDLAWCSYLSITQYKKLQEDWPQFRNIIDINSVQEEGYYIIPYTRLHGDNHAFYRYMEKYEIYGGRRSIDEFKGIVKKRYRNFKGTGNIFECAFFQNIIEELMLYAEYCDDKILDFYQELVSDINTDDLLIIRFICDDIIESLEHIRKERTNNQGDEVWYTLMLGYLKQSPYGKSHGMNNFEDVISHFNRRIKLENRILNELLPYKFIDLKSKDYQLDEILTFLSK